MLQKPIKKKKEKREKNEQKSSRDAHEMHSCDPGATSCTAITRSLPEGRSVSHAQLGAQLWLNIAPPGNRPTPKSEYRHPLIRLQYPLLARGAEIPIFPIVIELQYLRRRISKEDGSQRVAGNEMGFNISVISPRTISSRSFPSCSFALLFFFASTVIYRAFFFLRISPGARNSAAFLTVQNISRRRFKKTSISPYTVKIFFLGGTSSGLANEC